MVNITYNVNGHNRCDVISGLNQCYISAIAAIRNALL